MTQPPYGPPPQGPFDQGQIAGQPHYGPPAGAPGYGPPPGAPYGIPPGYPQDHSGATAPHPQAGQPVKKPFHKRPWVLVVAGLFVIGAVGNAVDGDETETAASSAATTSSSTTAPTTAAPTTPLQPVAPPVTPAPTTSAAPVVDFVMPDLVGIDLQTAQNVVQDNGVFLSTSHDLLGSRSQVLDSNWIVCTQNIPAGQRVTGDVEGAIDFGAVKREESCP